MDVFCLFVKKKKMYCSIHLLIFLRVVIIELEVKAGYTCVFLSCPWTPNVTHVT